MIQESHNASTMHLFLVVLRLLRYTERDRQAEIICRNIKSNCYKAQSHLRYCRVLSKAIGPMRAASEGYGFILGLQFTKQADGTPT